MPAASGPRGTRKRASWPRPSWRRVTIWQIPAHTHAFLAANVQGDQFSPAGNLPAQSFNVTPYLNGTPDGNRLNTAVTPTGGSQPHENRQPYLGINFIISLFGIFPQQT